MNPMKTKMGTGASKSANPLELTELPLTWFECMLDGLQVDRDALNTSDVLVSFVEALPIIKVKYWAHLFGTNEQNGAGRMIRKGKLLAFLVEARKLYADRRAKATGKESMIKALGKPCLQAMSDFFTNAKSSRIMKLFVYKLYCRRVLSFNPKKLEALFGGTFVADIQSGLTDHAMAMGRRIEIPDTAKLQYLGSSANADDLTIAHQCTGLNGKVNTSGPVEESMTTFQLKQKQHKLAREIEDTTQTIDSQRQSIGVSEATLAKLVQQRRDALEQIELARAREALIKKVEAVCKNPLAYKCIGDLVFLCLSDDVSGNDFIGEMLKTRVSLWELVQGPGKPIPHSVQSQVGLVTENDALAKMDETDDMETTNDQSLTLDDQAAPITIVSEPTAADENEKTGHEEPMQEEDMEVIEIDTSVSVDMDSSTSSKETAKTIEEQLDLGIESENGLEQSISNFPVAVDKTNVKTIHAVEMNQVDNGNLEDIGGDEPAPKRSRATI